MIAHPPPLLTHLTGDDVRRIGACWRGVRRIEYAHILTLWSVEEALEVAGNEAFYVQEAAGMAGRGFGSGAYGSWINGGDTDCFGEGCLRVQEDGYCWNDWGYGDYGAGDFTGSGYGTGFPVFDYGEGFGERFDANEEHSNLAKPLP